MSVVRQPQLVCDIFPGEPVTRTVLFEWERRRYTLDLSDSGYQYVLQAVGPLIDKARRAPVSPHVAGGPPTRTRNGTRNGARRKYAARVRAWAGERGIEVARAGRLSVAVVAQYEADQRKSRTKPA